MVPLRPLLFWVHFVLGTGYPVTTNCQPTVQCSLPLRVLIIFRTFHPVLPSEHTESIQSQGHAFLLRSSSLLSTLVRILTSNTAVPKNSIHAYFTFSSYFHIISLFLLKDLEHIDSSSFIPLTTKSVFLVCVISSLSYKLHFLSENNKIKLIY